MTETELLARLVAFPTLTGGPNLEMISWVQDHLAGCGFAVTRVASADGTKAGLLARFGEGPDGLLLSAHSDVVPVAGQSWSSDPFTLTARGDRLAGRGTTDMKGFLACVLAHAATLRAAPPSRPVMIALSWDEEIGCRGIAEMIGQVVPVLGRPGLCIVGEPTSMRLATGHKGKASYLARCHGEPGHSSMAPVFRNALHLACDLVAALRREQARLQAGGAQDPAYDMPCSTIHAGVMRGGVALNMVPELAEVEFEIRHLAQETAAEILAGVVQGLPGGIEITETGAYPGLEADPADPAIAALAAALPDPAPLKVAYGTEAGYFAGLGIPTAVCGPGTMKDGHQPDESIAVSELAACRALLARIA
ncbi:acetylornithine deacetylase [Poseidonocella sp. HB161398]|uniref:acetylornithine deacetylase n=1 Tax=Poseidonocella sp. HB161398 TaxID=2320855 RepID=UPI00110802B4|nr:acetylornithine deacetylase [Poseidonocella sp. HB161398]